MENITVVIYDKSGLAKDPHPLGAIPVKPFASDFKDKDKLNKALKLYEENLLNWNTIDEKLTRYSIESMVCDNGWVVSNSVLWWHIGKQYKAIILENKSLQII